jgi:arginyl-tRNA synthetase
VVFLGELLDAAVEKTRQVIAEKNPDLPNKDAVAEAVGCGAVVFNDLKKERVKDAVFAWDDVLALDGDTGPYVQYTHARLCSILRKAAVADATPDFDLLEDSGALLLTLGRFPAVVGSAARRAEPSEVAQYVLGLCREMNSWYVNHRVLGQDEALSAARLTLVRAVKIVIGNGLDLLGLAAPEEM